MHSYAEMCGYETLLLLLATLKIHNFMMQTVIKLYIAVDNSRNFTAYLIITQYPSCLIHKFTIWHFPALDFVECTYCMNLPCILLFLVMSSW